MLKDNKIYKGISYLFNFYHQRIKIVSLALYLIANLLLFMILYYNVFLIGFVQFIQFNFIILLLLYLMEKIKCPRFFYYPFIFLIIAFQFVLCLYNSVLHDDLIFSAVKSNIADLDKIIFHYQASLLIFFLLVMVCVFSLVKIKNQIKHKSYYLIFLLFIIISAFFSQPYQNKLYLFAKSIIWQDEIIKYYQRQRDSWINQSIANRQKIDQQISGLNKANLPSYLDNIIILHLESVNKHLVSRQHTPNFLDISSQGVFFPNFYGNSVQTILAQENILCSLPSSFNFNLVQTGKSRKVLCLPEILKKIGYRSFFYESDNSINFASTGDFMKDLLFDYIYAGDDFMPPASPLYKWGYREDVYYHEVFKHLQQRKQEKLNFLYIAVSSTNHTPFDIPLEYQNMVPYKDPKTFEQRISDTMFLQDKHLLVAWQEIDKMFPQKNYILIILGDHGYPAGIHSAHIFNAVGSSQENFFAPAIIILGRQKEYQNKIIQTKFSQMDILPSILSLFKLGLPVTQFSQNFFAQHQKNALDEVGSTNRSVAVGGLIPPASDTFGAGFAQEEGIKTRKNTKTILIQPYSNQYINIIDNHLKYKYDSKNKLFILYDLLQDPDEKNGQIIGQNDEDNLNIIKQLIP
ncbi:sulfatase-like hydrolase/transferase [Candidatus Kuenenbacteria bacterium]|nr:sulfatase-like hydrolase/transferase [Candidatus Kuenenbacteria bacterium]